jgi:pyrroline-5-carboxylate reductase
VGTTSPGGRLSSGKCEPPARAPSTVPAVHDVDLVVVGGGNMGAALLQGLSARGWAPPERLAVVELDAARRAVLAAEHPGVVVVGGFEDLLPRAGLVAVKPADVAGVCLALAAAGVRRVLSVAAGVTLARLEEALGEGVAVVRAMPNTPALVGEGAAAIAAGRDAGEDDLVWAESVLTAVGTVVRVPEYQLDAVTGVSGSGPAYLFLVAEALVDAAVLNGLPRPVARQLVVQLFRGSAALLAAGTGGPEQLRHEVTSPGGTTAAGLAALERAAVRAAFSDAVTAATVRSRELGRPADH